MPRRNLQRHQEGPRSGPVETVPSPDFSDILNQPRSTCQGKPIGFAPPYPDLSEFLPEDRSPKPQGPAVSRLIEPFDEDDEFAKRWVVCQIGRQYVSLPADTNFPPVAGPFTSKEADQFIVDMKLVQEIMDR